MKVREYCESFCDLWIEERGIVMFLDDVFPRDYSKCVAECEKDMGDPVMEKVIVSYVRGNYERMLIDMLIDIGSALRRVENVSTPECREMLTNLIDLSKQVVSYIDKIYNDCINKSEIEKIEKSVKELISELESHVCILYKLEEVV